MKHEINIILFVLRIFLGLFLLWSGVMKLRDLSAFTENVANYQLLSQPWDAYVAYFLPWLEILVGLALVSGLLLPGALLLTAGMMAAFIFGLGMAWSRGLNINCGCFGAGGDPMNYPWKIASNVAILAFSLFLWWRGRRDQHKKLWRVQGLKLPS